MTVSRIPNESLPKRAPTQMVRRLAPEEVARGDYLAILADIYEIMPFSCWDDACSRTESPPLRIPFIPREARTVWKVVSVCVPFVVAKDPTGQVSTFDLRLCVVGRLDREHGKLARKLLRRQAHKAAKKS